MTSTTLSADFNISAEQAILSIILSNKNAIDDVFSKLSVGDFYRGSHNLIFNCICDLYAKGVPIDLITVGEYIASKDLIDAVGGYEYISELALNNFVSHSNADFYIEIIKNKSVSRSLKQVGLDISVLPELNKDLTTPELINLAEEKIFNIQSNSHRENGLQHINYGLAELINVIEKNAFNDGAIGLPTGLTSLDAITGGLQKGDLIIIAGRPSMGKTALGINIAEYVALKEKKNVLIFSLEMTTVKIVGRIVSSLTLIDSFRLDRGRFTPEESNRFGSAISILNESAISIHEKSDITHLEIRSEIRRALMKGPVDLVVIDYLQLMKSTSKAENKNIEVAEISKALKGIAKDLKVPVIVLAQLNRGVEARPDKRPLLSDLRDSGSIEQDADIIALVYRDDYYNKQSSIPGIAEIIVAKNRNGETGTAKVRFTGKFTRFSNL